MNFTKTNPLLVTIPTSVGIEIDQRVIDSINNQYIPTEIKIIRNPELFDKSKYENYREGYTDRLKIIGESRSMCLPFLQEEDIAVMHDSRIVHLNMDNLWSMLKFLKNNPDIIAVALNKEPRHWKKELEHTHIGNGCIMARKIAWENANFMVGEKDPCTCIVFAKSIRKFGRYRLLDRNKRIEVIKKGDVKWR